MYIIDTQFGKINYVSGEVSPVVSTRINANAAYYVIEVYEQGDKDLGDAGQEPR